MALFLFEFLAKIKKRRRQFSKFWFPPLAFLRQNFSRYNTNMPSKVKIFHIYINYLVYKHFYYLLCNEILENID